MGRAASRVLLMVSVSWMGASALGCKPAAVTSTQAAVPSADNNPFLGVWRFDPIRSRLVAETLRYDDLGGGRMRFSSAGGSSYEFALDGNDHAAPGNRAVSWKAVAPGQWETSLKWNGKVIETSTRTLSRDGRSLDVLATGELPNGIPYRHTKHYVREGSGEGLAGTWRNVTTDTHDMPDGYVLSESASGVITWSIPTDKQSLSGRFDGTDMPLVGPTAPAGTTFSIRRIGERKIAYTMKTNGKVDQHGTVTISDDGNTFTEESWPPGRENEKSTSVFGKYACPAAPAQASPPGSKDVDWLCAAAR